MYQGTFIHAIDVNRRVGVFCCDPAIDGHLATDKLDIAAAMALGIVHSHTPAIYAGFHYYRSIIESDVSAVTRLSRRSAADSGSIRTSGNGQVATVDRDVSNVMPIVGPYTGSIRTSGNGQVATVDDDIHVGV